MKSNTNRSSTVTLIDLTEARRGEVIDQPVPRRRRRVSLARAFVGNKVNFVGMKLKNFQENNPKIVSTLLSLNAFGKLLIFFVDVVSDGTLAYEISDNGMVEGLYYAMLCCIFVQYIFGIVGLNLYFKKDLFQNPPARLKVGERVEARKPHWGYDVHQPGNVIQVNDSDNTYDIELYVWSYDNSGGANNESRIIKNVKQLEIKDYDDIPKYYFTRNDLKIIRKNNCKRVVGFLLSPVLVLVFDVIMLIYRPVQNMLHPQFLTFIIQYEAQRTVVEVCFESAPQAILQLLLYFRCLDDACGFEDQRAFALLSTSETLTISLCVSFISILRLVVTLYIATQAMGISVKQYVHHLLELGSGLNLDAICANTVKTLRFYNLSEAEISKLVPVLKNNTSAEEFFIDWENMSDLEVHMFVNETKHEAVLQSYIANIPFQYPKGTPFIIACEKGLLEVVRYYVEHFKKNDNFSNVTDFINQRGAAVGGYYGYTGLIIAAKNEHFHVVQYLLQQEGVDLSIVREGNNGNDKNTAPRGRNVVHYAAYYNKNTLETVKLLVNHKKCTANIINARNSDGSTPLDFAYVNTSMLKQQIINELRNHGAKRQEEENHDKKVLKITI
jgi:hypothetical protein